MKYYRKKTRKYHKAVEMEKPKAEAEVIAPTKVATNSQNITGKS